MTTDIRWIQRFYNFERALALLKEAIIIETPSDLEIEGVIQRFEYTFELAWKTLKDYLEDKGYTELVGSKEVIRQAFADGIITEGEVWMDMVRARNLTPTFTINKPLTTSRMTSSNCIMHVSVSFMIISRQSWHDYNRFEIWHKDTNMGHYPCSLTIQSNLYRSSPFWFKS